ncbi:hypothetical protein O6H91_18G071900 [Diphasiastrum complanatum]|uniref:Uncharacterized protein n=1 Tax=Diphasiastrum complanatum TaxID=34168 RepID=A0ACC2B2H7_DIPCM|nr:hypothetical protein O6H91_18G071900 [Diphasiastrum complanatum]
MTLRSRFLESRSLAADFVSSLPVVSTSSDHPHVIFTQPSVSSSNPVSGADRYGETTGIVLLMISLVLLVIRLGVYLYFHPPVHEIPSAEINGPPRQQAVRRRPGQKNEGLDPKIIESFPIMTYSAAEIAKNPAGCAVCLSEFQEGEKARLLPKCGHVFHLECIDKWLFSHSTCPLCRVSLIPESHTITVDSNTPHGSAGQETLDPAAPVNGEGVAALSEQTTSACNNGAERHGQTKATLMLILFIRGVQINN